MASSSPSFHTPKPSPRSALRSTSRGEASGTDASLCRCAGGPAVLRDEFAQWTAECPLVDLELRSRGELRDRAQAENRYRLGAVGYAQQRADLDGIEDRHPAHPEAFCA